MTARQVWEYALTELTKANAPSLLLHEFNYYLNKALYQFINKSYNAYDINQQITDNLRVLKATGIFDVTECEAYGSYAVGDAGLFKGTYYFYLPQDYMHMLNCICVYRMDKSYKCYDKDNYVQFAAKRLTADSWSVIVNDYYNRPLPERPYYYIHNVNAQDCIPTNPLKIRTVGGLVTNEGTDTYGVYEYNKDGNSENQFARVIKLGDKGENAVTNNVSVVDKPATLRYGNPQQVRCEIRYGNDDSVFKLEKVFVDYIKVPQNIRLTKEQVDLTEDRSQILEFPDYVCQEIVNELVTLLMARDADPRLQVQTQVSQSIASPTQQQTQPAAQAAQ